ncbi:MAG: glutaredoxin 3 [Pseudomonadota bacterium]
MSEIIIYTKDWCGYCSAAKSLLKQLKLSYKEIDVTYDHAQYAEMLKISSGRTSVPQIFIDGVGIGGYTDLSRLVRENKLPLKTE